MKLTRVALVALVLSLFAAGCGDEGNVFSLGVGDCFGEVGGGEISDVPIVDCSEPHENEVYAVWNVGDSLPSEDVMGQGCIDRFEDAIGAPFATSEIYAAPIMPTEGSFDQGDREVICYAFEIDSAGSPIEVTGSVLGSGR